MYVCMYVLSCVSFVWYSSSLICQVLFLWASVAVHFTRIRKHDCGRKKRLKREQFVFVIIRSEFVSERKVSHRKRIAQTDSAGKN